MDEIEINKLRMATRNIQNASEAHSAAVLELSRSSFKDASFKFEEAERTIDRLNATVSDLVILVELYIAR